MAKLVFKTHKIDIDAIYEIANSLTNRGFQINPKSKALKMKYTRNIIVDLQEGIFTPLGLGVFDDPSKFYFIEIED